MTLITNNQPREMMYWHDLTPAEQREFDGYDATDHTFVRYRGWVYDLGEFMACPDTFEFRGWVGSHVDSYFSAIVFRYVDNFERVIMGRAYS